MLTELWRITSFRLTVLYGGFFALAVLGLVALIYDQTSRYQNRQVDQILRSEVRVFSAATPQQLNADIAYEIERDIRHINFFGLFSATGEVLAGNLARVPSGLVLDGKPHALPEGADAGLFGDARSVRAQGQPLANGNVVVVARDMALLEELRESLLRGCLLIGAVILLLGVLGGVFYSLPAVRHIRSIDRAARRIADGDYRERLPLGQRNQDLDALAHIVNAMLDETERLLGEVKSCSDNIAHDLRTPLTRLRASIYRALQTAEEDDAQLPVMLNHALTQTDLLLTRFRAISRISEIESKRRRAGIASVALEPVLRKIAGLYEPLALQGEVRLGLECEPVPLVECDGELLFEAIGNLVDNAIKFTPPGGKVDIALRVTPDGTEIAVSDTGPGIAEDQRRAVLQRFYRVVDTRHLPGSGLGLSLVDAIMRLHDFGLVLDEAPQGGARVRLQCWRQRAA
jgi:signal transduction histidine kinase